MGDTSGASTSIGCTVICSYRHGRVSVLALRTQSDRVILGLSVECSIAVPKSPDRSPASPIRAFGGTGDYLFISYSHRDAEFVLGEIAFLNANGINTWFDEGIEPGGFWLDEIAEKITRCTGFLFFASPAAVESRHCQNELNFALGLDKPIASIEQPGTNLTPGIEIILGSRHRVAVPEIRATTHREQMHVVARGLVRGRQMFLTSKSTSDVPKLTDLAGWIRRFLSQKTKTDEDTAKTSLIVLPLTNRAGRDSEVACTGIHEDLLSLLVKNPGLDIVRLKPKRGSDPVEAARRAGVQYLVQGSFDAFYDEFSIRLELIDANSRRLLWTQRYRRSALELLEMQGDLIRGLAETLGPAIFHSEGKRITQHQTNSLRAWELVHQAYLLEYQAYSPESSQQAEELCRLALELDPDYPVAISTLARLIANRAGMMISDEPQADFAEAAALAERAIQLAPDDSRVMLDTAIVRGNLWDIDGALPLVQRALHSDPSLVGALSFLGTVLILGLRRPEEGIAAIQHALEADPHNLRSYLELTHIATGYLMLNDARKARTVVKTALSFHPKFHLAWLKLAEIECREGAEEECRQAFKRLRVVAPFVSDARLETYLERIRVSSLRSRMTALWRETA